MVATAGGKTESVADTQIFPRDFSFINTALTVDVRLIPDDSIPQGHRTQCLLRGNLPHPYSKSGLLPKLIVHIHRLRRDDAGGFFVTYLDNKIW